MANTDILASAQQLLRSGERMPLVIEPKEPRRDLALFIHEYQASLSKALLEHGAILFRGFSVDDAQDFARATDAMSSHKLDYNYRSTPRTNLGRGVYTATEYPASQEIPLHNENAYQREWPLKIALCCLRPADSGGETPVADMRKVCASLGSLLMQRFQMRKVLYVRHYRPHLDIPWQTVFQTQDRREVERYCDSKGIKYDWLDHETLRTEQVSQGVAFHPITGERVFFNQAHLFHVSSTGSEAARSLLQLFGPTRLPRNAYFGDGEDILPEELELIRNAFSSNMITFAWEKGDTLLADNMQVAHGRKAFAGKRQVLASLLDPHSPTQ